MLRLKKLLPALLMSALALPAPGDTLYLKNGKQLDGTILSSGERDTVIVHNGMKLNFGRELVDRIERNDRRSAETGSGATTADSAQSGRDEKAFVNYLSAYRRQSGDPRSFEQLALCRRELSEKIATAYPPNGEPEIITERIRYLEERIAGSDRESEEGMLICLELSTLHGLIASLRQNFMLDDEARDSLKRAVEWLPENDAALLELARLYMRGDEWASALPVLERLNQLRPGEPNGALAIAETWLRLGEYDRGLQRYEGQIAQSAENAELRPLILDFENRCADALGQAHRRRGRLLAAQGKTEEALREYNVGVSLTEDSLDGLQEDMQFYRSLGANAELARTERNLARFKIQQEEETRRRQTQMVHVSGGGAMRATSYSSALNKAQKSNRNSLVIFSASWCGYCKQLKRESLPHAAVKQALENYVLLEIDAEKGEGVALAKRYGVTGYPTLVVLDRSGREKAKLAGYLPGPDLANWLKVQ